jgi:peptidoglycan-N-acetylglucosamine deacetylase
MIPVYTPKILKHLFPQLIWEVDTKEKIIYLTFDDGPEPEVTPRVLALLFEHNVKATFFCLGEKAEKYPEILSQIQNSGHSIGNHGYKHISGFTSTRKVYFENFIKGARYTNPGLFRPPYGRITPFQMKSILPQSRIVLWSIMSMDFHPKTTREKCYHHVTSNAFPGAIVVFHDSLRNSDTLLGSLPKIITSLKEKGYNFAPIY